jgi:hypothetical protein
MGDYLIPLYRKGISLGRGYISDTQRARCLHVKRLISWQVQSYF